MESNSISFGGSNHGLQIGQVGNHSSIHAEFHPPERPETPPSPFSNVPFPRDPDFVQLDTLIDQIHEKCSVSGSRTAVVGLGGVGKSKLAIEYSYQIRSTSPETWLFWIHASNKARLEQSFRALADQLKLPGRRDSKINIFQLVENWLRDEKKGKWACILDNVDDESLFSLPEDGNGGNKPVKESTNAPVKPLLEYIPRSSHGSTIITSRSREVALKMVDHHDLVEVKPMEGSEALELFERKLGSTESSELISPKETEERRKLVGALEFMPLAIVQAASHIRSRGTRYSVAQYLSDFQSDREATKLLRKSTGFTYRDWEAENSILVTWGMSFNHIREMKPSAADLLSLMCFFDRQSIPEILLHDRPEREIVPGSYVSKDSDYSDYSESSESESDNDKDDDDDDDFEDDVATLRNYAFISVNEDGSFAMHRLVQLSTRAWLNSHEQTERWKHQFIRTLSEEFPMGQFEDWNKCQILWPHIISAASHRPASESPESLLQWAELLYYGAWYAEERGLFAEMMEMASLSKKYRVKLLGAQSELALQSRGILGRAYHARGQWDMAEELLVQVLEDRKKIFGDDHPTTLISMNHLALMYGSQGRWKEAEELDLLALGATSTSDGESDRYRLRNMTNLAFIYHNQGQWKESERILKHVLEKLGEDHLDAPVVMSHLASIYRSQGRWDEGERLEIRLLEVNKARLGENHPDTLTNMANLAVTHMKQNRWEEAEDLLVHVVEAQKIKLGEDHPNTLTGITNLAWMYQERGQLEEAKELNLQVIKAQSIKPGLNHPDTLTSISNLAMVYQKLGDFEEAERLGLQAIEGYETNVGKDHPVMLITVACLASMYRDQERWEDSERFYVRALEGFKAKLGEDHRDTILTMGNLAVLLKMLGRDAEAITLFRDYAAKHSEVFGLDHPNTLEALEALLEWERANMNVSS